MSIAVLILLPIAIGTVSVVAAQNEQFSPPKRFYLALGDSITYGFQQSKVEGGVLNASAFTTGYVDAYVGTQREAALGFLRCSIRKGTCRTKSGRCAH